MMLHNQQIPVLENPAGQHLLRTFPSVSLEEMGEVSLLKRTDTKFLLHKKLLEKVLEEIRGKYTVLEICNRRVFSYDSYYFDTPEKNFFLHHHNGRANRNKVRIRKYVDTGSCFLEVKHKNGKGKTVKARKDLPYFKPVLTEEAQEFILNNIPAPGELSFSLRTQFKRLTLVNLVEKERATIDMDIRFSADLDGAVQTAYGDIIIAEVKQERFNRNTPLAAALKRHGVLPYNISKYCTGLVSFDKGLKYNRFKKKLLKIKRICEQE